jgi:hypothetical protein
MQSSVKVSRVASGLLRQAVAFKFCVDWAPMDPRKHTTMNHNPHAMYLDLYEYGHYPDWVHIGSQAPSTYQPQVLAILAATLSARYVLLVPPSARPSLPPSCSPRATAPGLVCSART